MYTLNWLLSPHLGGGIQKTTEAPPWSQAWEGAQGRVPGARVLPHETQPGPA